MADDGLRQNVTLVLRHAPLPDADATASSVHEHRDLTPR